MNIKNTLISASLSASILLGASSVAFAQTPTYGPWQQRAQERQEARQERIEERVNRRCDIVNNRIEARIARYQQHSDDVETRMERVTTRTTEFVNRLESKGYDVSQVISDLQALEGMRNTRRSLYTAFIAELEQARQYDCGNSDGAFKTALDEAKAALAKWREQIRSNQEYIRTTLRSDFQALRGQNPVPSVSQ